tara:strand:- start:767 stop:952 length:186 start_codon:yes stop_codon:yes gene_type:complete
VVLVLVLLLLLLRWEILHHLMLNILFSLVVVVVDVTLVVAVVPVDTEPQLVLQYLLILHIL